MKTSNQHTFLVTGGAGFIGSHLCEELLRQDRKVICLDNFHPLYDPKIKRNNLAGCLEHPQFTLIEGDIRQPEDLDKCFAGNQIDMALHLAAMAGVRPSIEQPELYADVNVLGTLQVLNACVRHQVRKIVFASSSSVYGNSSKPAFNETERVDSPVSPYAATKRAGELLCHTYHHLHGLDIVILRFFTVYGPRQRPDLAIHKFTRLLYADQPIPVYGDGTSGRDYTYISDIMEGVLHGMTYVKKHHCCEIFNLGEQIPISLLELLDTLQRLSGKTARLDWQPPQLGDVQRTCADLAKSRQLLNYRPSISFETGISHFLRWFESTLK